MHANYLRIAELEYECQIRDPGGELVRPDPPPSIKPKMTQVEAISDINSRLDRINDGVCIICTKPGPIHAHWGK